MALFCKKNLLSFLKATALSCGVLLANQYAQDDAGLHQILGYRSAVWDMILNGITGILVCAGFIFHFIPDYKIIATEEEHKIPGKQTSVILADLA